ncbi:hypothetical protein [Paenibacillus sp. PvR053]
MRLGRFIRLQAVMLAACVLLFLPAQIEAEIKEATASEKVVLYAQFPLYSKPDFLAPSDGALAPVQTIEVQAPDLAPEGWYLTKTWLGERWIFLGRGSELPVVFPKNETITLLNETALYDTPDLNTATGVRLSAQKIQTTGSLGFCNGGLRSNCDLTWWQVDTWLGEKWILPSEYAEKIKEKPLDAKFRTPFESPLYLLPFESRKTDEKLEVGTEVQLKAMYSYVPSRTGPVTWYKMDTSTGERWFKDPYNTFFGVESTDEKVSIQVPFRYYSGPRLETAEPGLNEPLELTVFEKKVNGWTGWFHVRTSKGDKWVHPERALQERPPGIKETNESIHVAPSSVVSDYPFHDPFSVGKVELEEQEVQATHVYADPSGETWYRISTMHGDKWVLVQQPD